LFDLIEASPYYISKVFSNWRLLMEENENKRNSRRNFIKTGAVAGGAAVIGLTMGLPALTKATTETEQQQNTNSNLLLDSDTDKDYNYGSSTYKPQERWFFMYATDGVAWLPTDKFGLARRPIYTYGFAKPLSDTNPSGNAVGKVGDRGVGPPDENQIAAAFADLNWIDESTNMPVMAGKAQLTGPPIWGVEGDILDITLFNLGFAFPTGIMDPHTIHLHGVHAPNYYDGIPEISFGIPMWWNTGPTMRPAPMTKKNIKNFSFTYRMYCERPGTYMYHCHVEASEHVQMGMYGPLWIYPKNYANVVNGGAAYNNSLTQFDQEVFLLLSEFDSRWHDSIMDFNPDRFPDFATKEPTPTTVGLVEGPAYNIPDYRPDYWLVNGRSLPDTVLAGKYNINYQKGLLFTPNPTTPPQGSLLTPIAQQITYYPAVTSISSAGPTGDLGGKIPSLPVYIPRQPIQTYVRTAVAQKVLVRLHNMGFQAQPMHFHGVMPNVVGKDTFAWVPQMNSMFGTTTDERKRVFTQGLFSGEAYDMIIAYPDKAAISPTVYGFLKTDPKPVAMPFSASEPGIGPPLTATSSYATVLNTVDSGIPIAANLPSAVPADATVADGFYRGYPLLYLWHVHDDYKVTNNGTYPGGAVTVVRVDKQNTLGPKPSLVQSKIPV
jgi:manganese oxidase